MSGVSSRDSEAGEDRRILMIFPEANNAPLAVPLADLFAWQRFKWIDDDCIHWREMSHVPREDRQLMKTSCGSDSDVGKIRCIPAATRKGGQSSRQLCRREVEGQHWVSVKVSQMLQPVRQGSSLPHCTLSARFGHAVSDLGDRHNREKEPLRIFIHPLGEDGTTDFDC